MDIEYLLALQNLRSALPDWVSAVMTSASSQAFIVVGFLAICMVYWAVDRSAGKRIFFGVVLGIFANGLLKLIFCAYRPWVRDARVTPFGDSIKGATGYSFPSGHATYATTIFGGMGFWAWARHRLVAIVCGAFVLLVIFSRNFLGVHTPQDVIAGFLSSVLVMWVAYKIEGWTDRNPDRDKTVMIVGLVICAIAAVFYLVKPYPLDYTAEGSLLVDPAKMIGDSFQGVGLVAAYVVCRYFERRGFAFDELLPKRTRAIIGGVAIIPLAGWVFLTLKVLKVVLGANLGYFIGFGGMVVYLMILVPKAMELVYRKQQSK